MSRESSLWKWFSKDFGNYTDLDYHRIENMLGGGFPDCIPIYKGLGLFVELKVGKPMKTPGRYRVKYEPLQIPWHKRCHRKKGISFILIRLGKEHYLVYGKDAYLTEGNIHKDDLKDITLVLPNCRAEDILETCYRETKQLVSQVNSRT